MDARVMQDIDGYSSSCVNVSQLILTELQPAGLDGRRGARVVSSLIQNRVLRPSSTTLQTLPNNLRQPTSGTR